MCKGKTNSFELELLSNMAYQSPAMLKERCGYSKTYLQRDLDLSELSSTSVSRIVSMHTCLGLGLGGDNRNLGLL